MAGAVRRLDCWRGDFNARCLGLSAHNVHDAREIVGEHVQPSRWLPLEEKAEIKSVLNEFP
jgi:hypothetical protein